MKKPILKLNDLAGMDLVEFEITEMTEVYLVNEDGRKVLSLGFFRQKETAEAFAGAQTDASSHKTGMGFVLTNGKIGYVITQQEPVTLFDDEAEAIELKKKALEKLSPAERSLLGFGD